MKRRRPPPPRVDDLSDDQAAALERYVTAPGWRLDELAGVSPRAVTWLLAQRWRRTPPEIREARLADARRGVLWAAGLRQHAHWYPPEQRAPEP